LLRLDLLRLTILPLPLRELLGTLGLLLLSSLGLLLSALGLLLRLLLRPFGTLRLLLLDSLRLLSALLRLLSLLGLTILLRSGSCRLPLAASLVSALSLILRPALLTLMVGLCG